MDIPALNLSVHQAVDANQVPLERLAGNTNLSEREKVGELCRQFEAVLLREILRSTQKTVIQSSLADNSAAGGIYKDMVTDQLADSISRSRSFGLARSLEAELTRQLMPDPQAEESSIEH